MLKRIFAPEYVAVLLFAALFVFMFLISPVVSVADNGDFERLMSSVGIEKYPDTPDNSFYNYAQIKYILSSLIYIGANGYITTHALCAAIAKLLNAVFYSTIEFDIRFLALIYFTAAATGLFLLVKTLKTGKWYLDYAFVLLLWLMLCDGTYLAYMNSFYGEGCSYSFLLLLLGIGVRIAHLGEQTKKRDVFLLIFAMMMFFGSKLQYTLLAPIALLFLIPLKKCALITRRQLIASTTLLILVNITIYVVAPPDLSEDTLYNSVFYGVLKDSKTPAQDASVIGLNEEYVYLAGTNAYTPDTPNSNKDPKFMECFFDGMSRSCIIGFYITHPLRFVEKMELTAHGSFDNLLGMFGNFQKVDGFEPFTKNTSFTLYNAIKYYMPKSFLLIVLYFGVYLTILFRELVQGKGRANLSKWLLLMVLCIGIAQFPLPVLGNGEADISKQLFIFNFVFDMSLILAVFWGVKKIAAIPKSSWKKPFASL